MCVSLKAISAGILFLTYKQIKIESVVSGKSLSTPTSGLSTAASVISLVRILIHCGEALTPLAILYLYCIYHDQVMKKRKRKKKNYKNSTIFVVFFAFVLEVKYVTNHRAEFVQTLGSTYAYDLSVLKTYSSKYPWVQIAITKKWGGRVGGYNGI